MEKPQFNIGSEAERLNGDSAGLPKSSNSNNNLNSSTSNNSPSSNSTHNTSQASTVGGESKNSVTNNDASESKPSKNNTPTGSNNTGSQGVNTSTDKTTAGPKSDSGQGGLNDSVKSIGSENLAPPKSIGKTLNEFESSSSVNKAGATTGDSDLEAHEDQVGDNQDGDEQTKEMMEKKAAKDRKGAIIYQNLKKKGKLL